jgi:hypothetical protein
MGFVNLPSRSAQSSHSSWKLFEDKLHINGNFLLHRSCELSLLYWNENHRSEFRIFPPVTNDDGLLSSQSFSPKKELSVLLVFFRVFTVPVFITD